MTITVCENVPYICGYYNKHIHNGIVVKVRKIDDRLIVRGSHFNDTLDTMKFIVGAGKVVLSNGVVLSDVAIRIYENDAVAMAHSLENDIFNILGHLRIDTSEQNFIRFGDIPTRVYDLLSRIKNNINFADSINYDLNHLTKWKCSLMLTAFHEYINIVSGKVKTDDSKIVVNDLGFSELQLLSNRRSF